MRLEILFLVLFTGIISTTKLMAQTQIQKDKLEITQVSKARAKAFNQMDAVEIAKYFASDGILMAPGKEVSIGQKEVAEYYQAIFNEFDVVLESYYEEVEVSGDLAYGRGEAEVRATSKIDSVESIARSKYLNILKRQADGSWKTTHDIWNGNSVTIE